MSKLDYTEFTKNISYKRDRLKFKEPDEDKVNQAYEFLKEVIPAIPTIRDTFKDCESAVDFYKAFPSFKFTGNNSEEAFYRLKLGMKVDGVPSRIIYILRKAIKAHGTEFPNLTLQSVYKLLAQYDDFTFENDGNEITLINVVEYAFGKPVKLITARRPRVDNEVYVANANRIAIIPDDILELVKGEITFEPSRGLLGEVDNQLVELRILSDRLGVTTDDFDLRKAF